MKGDSFLEANATNVVVVVVTLIAPSSSPGDELRFACRLVPAQRPAAGVFERERETRRAGEAFRLLIAEAGRRVRECLRGF